MKLPLCLTTLICCFIYSVSDCRAGIVIPYAGYDINDAVMSGHGNWFHTYSGTITPGLNFDNFTNPGTTATYSGVGSGTLNDGIFGTSESNTQLFVVPQASDGTLIDPAIFITLSTPYFIDDIDFYGGDIAGNSIPGALNQVTVQLLDTNFVLHTETFATTPFGPDNGSGPVNDTISLAGSSLQNVPTVAVFLSGFQGTLQNWFSITELQLVGRNVPEPSSLFLLSAAGVFFAARRRKR